LDIRFHHSVHRVRAAAADSDDLYFFNKSSERNSEQKFFRIIFSFSFCRKAQKRTHEKALMLPTQKITTFVGLFSSDCCISREEERERDTISPERERHKKKNDFDREKQKKQNFSNRIRSCTLMEAALDGTNFGAAEAAGVVVDAESPSFSARGVMLILL
jgi:hypothetical protein